MVIAPKRQEDNYKIQLYRLFVIGKKSLPEIRKKSEARTSERFWARVGGIFKDPNENYKRTLLNEFRKGDAARLVGEGKYAIVKKHQNHAELAYILEMPKEAGEAQKELGIEKEATYIISVINPQRNQQHPTVAAGGGYPSTEALPMYPEEVLKAFNDSDIFVPLSSNSKSKTHRLPKRTDYYLLA